MPVASFVVLHAKFLDVRVAVEFEEEGLALNWFTAAARLPGNGGEESEHAVVLRLAD